MTVSAKNTGTGIGEKIAFMSFREYSGQVHPSLAAPALAGDGFFSSRQLLFESWDWDDLNEPGNRGLGTYVPVGEMPWLAVLIVAMMLGMSVWWRKKT
jgi:hypothetical protein